MPLHFSRMEKVKYTFSDFCNVTAIILDLKAFCDNFVTELLLFKMLKKMQHVV